MAPTIGRIVIYKPEEKSSMGDQPLPAIVVFVKDETTVNLQVFLNRITGTMFVYDTTQGDQPGNWNWPVIPK